MTTSLLFATALLSSACACEPASARQRQTREHVVAALQAEKSVSKQPAPNSPSAPAKKPAPKQRDQRPAPPAHLFM